MTYPVSSSLIGLSVIGTLVQSSFTVGYNMLFFLKCGVSVLMSHFENPVAMI